MEEKKKIQSMTQQQLEELNLKFKQTCLEGELKAEDINKNNKNKYDKRWQDFLQMFQKKYIQNVAGKYSPYSNRHFSGFSIHGQNDDQWVTLFGICQKYESILGILKEFKDKKLLKCFSIYLGNAVGDALGAHTEFQIFQPHQKLLTTNDWEGVQKFIIDRRQKKRTDLGVITDDCSMANCMADSILCNNMNFNPTDLRIRFILWWFTGYNNGSKNDSSFGLGGNISKGFESFLTSKELKPFVVDGDQPKGNVNGNGGVMRLSPIPIAYHDNLEFGEKVAVLQSLTTHNGEEAAECCRFLTHLLIKLINYDEQDQRFKNSKEYMVYVCDNFVSTNPRVQCLAKSQQYKLPPQEINQFNQSSDDTNFNWRDKNYFLSKTRHTLTPTYYGSYVIDGVYTALHISYHSNSQMEAIFQAVNWGGDSDSIAAMVGYICGGLYGLNEEILTTYEQKMYKHDDLNNLVKTFKLYYKKNIFTEAIYKEKNAVIYKHQKIIAKDIKDDYKEKSNLKNISSIPNAGDIENISSIGDEGLTQASKIKSEIRQPSYKTQPTPK